MTGLARLGTAAATALLATFFIASDAVADRTALVVGGQLGRQEVRALRSAALEAVEAAGWRVVESDLRSAAVSDLLSCITRDASEDGGCLSGLLDSTNVDRAVVLRVTSTKYEGEHFRVLTGWVFRRSGKALAFDQRFCERCQSEQLEGNARSLVAVLIRSARSRATPSLLAVQSIPPGARIVLDDKLVGVTDMEFRVYPGRHVVRLEKDGFRAETREVMIDDGEHATIDVGLRRKEATARKPPPQNPTTLPPPEPMPPQPPSRLGPWLLVAGGGAAIVTGGILLGTDETDSSGGGVRGREFNDTSRVGIAIGGAGVVLSGIGIYLLLHHQEPAATPIVSVGSDAAWIGVVGRF